MKCAAQEAKSPVKENLVSQRCAEGFNPGVKELNVVVFKHVLSQTVNNHS
jgi:hypothetical protein